DQGVVGVKRFLDRIWVWVNGFVGAGLARPIRGRAAKASPYKDSEKTLRALNKLIKKITEDIEQFHFNTCISAFMEFHNEVKDEAISASSIKTFLKLLYPFAPHLSEELSSIMAPRLGSESSSGKQSVQQEPWPTY